MPARREEDPYPNCNFRVEIDEVAAAGFRKVVMPEAAAEVIEYREGADLRVRKILGNVRHGNVVLTRGITQDNALYQWWLQVSQGSTDRRAMSIILLNRQREEVKRWRLAEAWPVRFKLGNLDAMGAGVAIEVLEIAYEMMEQA